MQNEIPKEFDGDYVSAADDEEKKCIINLEEEEASTGYPLQRQW